jgi:dienelactone hydrolase
VVIFLPDIFGVDLVNTKLLADEWAGTGWKVLLPDVFEGDAVGHEHLKVWATVPIISQCGVCARGRADMYIGYRP